MAKTYTIEFTDAEIRDAYKYGACELTDEEVEQIAKDLRNMFDEYFHDWVNA